MSLDVDFLQLYSLMDYSLLLVISYNEKYVEKNRHLFEQDEVTGELVKPYREKSALPVQELERKKFHKKYLEQRQKIKEKIAADFMEKMTGYTAEEFAAKRKEYEDAIKRTGHEYTEFKFNYNNMVAVRDDKPIVGTFKLQMGDDDNADEQAAYIEEDDPLYQELLPDGFIDPATGKKRNRHQFMSSDGKYIYHVGIIDYLQLFNFGKTVEHYWKDRFTKKYLVSAVPPGPYATRFFDFMQKEVVINQSIKVGKQKPYVLEELAE